MSGTISRFFSDRLAVAFNNDRWSWGAYDATPNRVFLRVWQDGLSSDGTSVEVLWDDDPPSDAGASERRRHVDLILAGAEAYGVLCTRDPSSKKTRIKSFDPDELLVLGKPVRIGDRMAAPILGRMAVDLLDRERRTSDLEEADIWSDARLTETQKKNLVAARQGQGLYRRRLLEKWDHRCAVTGCTLVDAIRASHAKPWSLSSNTERLDPENGLPLIATLDALFDRGLVGFSQTGEMLVSARVDEHQRTLIGVPQSLRRRPGRRCAEYLKWHAAIRFKP